MVRVLCCGLLLGVLGQRVHFNVEGAAGLQGVQGRDRVGVRDDRDRDDVTEDGGHGERDALDRDRALRSDVPAQSGRDGKAQPPVTGGLVRWVNGLQREERADAIDVALYDVAAERRAGRSGKFEVDDVAGLELGELGAFDRLLGEIGGELGMGEVKRGETDARDGDRIPGAQTRREVRGGDGEAGRPHGVAGGDDGDDDSRGCDQAGEHASSLEQRRQVLPRVAKQAGDFDVVAESAFFHPEQILLEGKGSGAAGSEGKGILAELGLGIEEDSAVDELLAEEGAVQGGAGLEQKTQKFCCVKVVEEFGQAEGKRAGKLRDADAAGFKGLQLFGCGVLGAEDPEVAGCGLD